MEDDSFRGKKRRLPVHPHISEMMKMMMMVAICGQKVTFE